MTVRSIVRWIGGGCVSAAGVLAAVVLLEAAAGSRMTAQETTALYGARGVSPLAVRQGYLGSCYFHASIAAVAEAAPETLRSAISVIPDGGYRVHFFAGPAEVVFPEDVAYGREHGYDRSEGVWVAVLMRAYAQRALRMGLVDAIQKSDSIPMFTKPLALSLLDQSGPLLAGYDRAIRSLVQQDGAIDKTTLKAKLGSQLKVLGIPGTEAELLVGLLDAKGFFDAVALTVQQNGEVFGAYKSLGQGGIPVGVIEAFLGHATAGSVTEKGQLMGVLGRLRGGGVAIVASTSASVPALGQEAKGPSWWVAAHSYTVLGYDDAAQTITLRNPWGTKPEPDGVFTLAMADFLQAYDTFSYSQAQ